MIHRVIIVGAGPAGAALAYLLAKHGVAVTLIERQRDFEREFRGEILMPSGREVFHQIGLDKQFEALPVRELRRLKVNLRGKPLMEIELTSLLGREVAFRAVSQPAMLEMLVGEASRFDGFEFHRGASVRELIRENGRVIGVRGSIAGKPIEVRGALVIGADGRASTIRRTGEFDDSPASGSTPDQFFDIVWCKAPLPAGAAAYDGARLFLGRGHFALVYPTFDDTLQIAWVIRKGSIGELRKCGVEEWVSDMAEHVSPELGTHLRANLGEIKHPFLLDVVCFMLRKWTAPGLLLIGDAAHPMSPVGGQGINIALRDAIVAANHLVPVLREGGSIEAIDRECEAVEAERMPEVDRIQRLQQQPPRVLFAPTWLSRMVIGAFPIIARTGLLRRTARGLLGEFAFGVRDVRLTLPISPAAERDRYAGKG
ncbi:MAG: FAD-dependent oxidoreductase [Phycisphaerales bacterium]|nr:FAD-dependent oxidoreductase [Phycisphaerales bacterium]